MLVSILLTMEDADGKLIEKEQEILYLHGNYGQIFAKVEKMLEGKSVGETFEVALSPDEAFGEYDEALVISEPLSELPQDVSVGMELESEDETIFWVVQEIKEKEAVINGNHPLAGVSLKLKGKILELQQLSKEGVEEILKMEEEH